MKLAVVGKVVTSHSQRLPTHLLLLPCSTQGLFWKYAEVTGNPLWKGMTWGMLPSLGSAMCACTWHFFYNAPSLEFLVALQAGFEQGTEGSRPGVWVCTDLGSGAWLVWALLSGREGTEGVIQLAGRQVSSVWHQGLSQAWGRV